MPGRWPVGGHLPRVSDAELGRMIPFEQAQYHEDRMRVYQARGMFCAKLAVLAAVVAVVLAVLSMIGA